MTEEFWKQWVKAGELERLHLVETLTMPSIKSGNNFKYECASLMNSYFNDLYNYLKEEK